MATPDDEMPEGFSRSEDGKSYANGFAFAGLKDLPAGVVNVTPQAGDVVVMTEMLAHGTLQWQPKDRLRRTLVLRYRPQFKGSSAVPETIHSRLSPETRELLAHAHYTHVKEVAKGDVVRLS